MYAVKILENNQYELLPIKGEDMCAGGYILFYYDIELFQVLFYLGKNYRLISPPQAPTRSSKASVCFYK